MAFDENNNPGSRAMLDRYILNYMRRRRLTTAADIFANEAEITDDSVEMDGLLRDWWALFHDTYISRPQFRPQEQTASPLSSLGSSQEVNISATISMIPREGASAVIFDPLPPMPSAEASSSPELRLSLAEREASRVLTGFIIGFVVFDLFLDFVVRS